MKRSESAAGSGAEAATEVILWTFRTNGLLLRSGDLLASDEGLSSARWQVLGAIALAGRPLTVPQIARRMGLTRQSVHATVGRLVADDLLQFLPNADHQRSQLVQLTELGRAKYRAMERRQVAWVSRLTEGLGVSNLETTERTLRELCRRLETDSGGSRKRREAERRDDMNVWAIPMLVSGGLFSGGVTVFAWERIPVWRALTVPRFKTEFATTIHVADRVQPALLVASILTAAGFALGERRGSNPGHHRRRRLRRDPGGVGGRACAAPASNHRVVSGTGGPR
ncbi:MAG TPA: MarR family winged helix-turn-helix transcriptional regulator [Actinomycetota bacterium]|jgi:DNA-binding MarR family transcriptional regulator|nr:MarR family winged helix-turn-helix transcriptional regulator [Actinomycetota bacterium]